MGAHYCIGAPLAKVEAEADSRALLTRLTSIRLVARVVLPRGPDWMLQSAGAVQLETGELLRR